MERSHGGKRKHRPLRTCIGCRGRFPAPELVRFVVGPTGEVGLDAWRRNPGRGAWTCARRKCLAEAVSRGAFGRAFRRSVVPPDVGDCWRRIKATWDPEAVDGG